MSFCIRGLSSRGQYKLTFDFKYSIKINSEATLTTYAIGMAQEESCVNKHTLFILSIF